MGRPERPLDPESGSLQRFAYDLRQLRLDAGSPSYRELARKTQYSTSALSRAASGHELPSLAVTLAYAGACGGDIKDWQGRWEALSRQSQLPAENPSLAMSAALPPLPHDGADPKDVGCVTGAVTIAAAQIRAAQPVAAAGQLFGPGEVLGTVELRSSAHCRAAWARVTPVSAFDHPLSGQEIVSVTRPVDHGGSDWSPGRVEEAYSDLLRTSGGCISAYAVFMIADGHQASAHTPCRQGP